MPGRPLKYHLEGEEFGSWRVLARWKPKKGNAQVWLCRCSCGAEVSVCQSTLVGGKSTKCRQCAWGKEFHGLRRHELYSVWQNMRRRCQDPKAIGYENYGARGISVHEPWVSSFPIFLRDIYKEIGPRPSGTSLDRVNNDGNYEPGNVRWATSKAQANNRRQHPRARDWVAIKATNESKVDVFTHLSDLTAKYLRSVLLYDPLTGEFSWRDCVGFKRKRNSVGSRSNGYKVIWLSGKLYKAHRLAWLHFYGKWPDGFIDHTDGNRDNNRILNLRDVTRTQNNRNSSLSKRNRSGHKGIIWHKKARKWMAGVWAGRPHYLGLFDNLEDAVVARKEALHKLHGEFGRMM